MTSPGTTLPLEMALCPKCSQPYKRSFGSCCYQCRRAYFKEYWKRNKTEKSKYRQDYRKILKSCPEQFAKRQQRDRELSREFIGRNRENGVWRAMIHRCHDPKNKQYGDYGARGITVCDRWQGDNGYINFLADMGKRPSGKHTLDRKRNNEGYSPGNCRWIEMKDQQRNRRNNVVIEYCGQKKCISEWAEEFGIPYDRLTQRIKKLGWSAEKALTEGRSKMWSDHDELCKRSVKWLRGTKQCNAVLCEMRCWSEIPDAIGWKGTRSYLVECKTSREDFFADAKKYFRLKPEHGVGQYRYYMVPPGLIEAEEVPDGWGLLYAGTRMREVRKPLAFMQRNHFAEIQMLVSALRRTQLRIDEPLHEWLKWDSASSLIQPTIAIEAD